MGDTHPCAVHWPDLETGGVVAADLLLELFCVRKRVVAQVHVALKRECELAVGEHLCGDVFVVEPGEDGLEGVESPVEGEHDLGGHRLHFLFVSDSHVFCVEGAGKESRGQVGMGWV